MVFLNDESLDGGYPLRSLASLPLGLFLGLRRLGHEVKLLSHGIPGP